MSISADTIFDRIRTTNTRLAEANTPREYRAQLISMRVDLMKAYERKHKRAKSLRRGGYK